MRLLNEFRHEQRDPDRFYDAMAQDSVGQVGSYVDLDGVVLLDVGAGRGYFRDAFRDVGATYVTLDADLAELTARGSSAGPALVGDGGVLPVRSDSLDVCLCVNVLEHVAAPWRLADEMLRVTKPGGTAVISYTVWWGPWGGHETSPWHYLGGGPARRLYERRHHRPPKNVYGESLFAVTVGAGLGWARARERGGLVDVVEIAPRYHPRWATGVLRVPVLRELLTWNLVIVLRKR